MARLVSPWISSHGSIRVPTAALEYEALAALFAVVLATRRFFPP
jgi:hypothetical protein